MNADEPPPGWEDTPGLNDTTPAAGAGAEARAGVGDGQVRCAAARSLSARRRAARPTCDAQIAAVLHSHERKASCAQLAYRVSRARGLLTPRVGLRLIRRRRALRTGHRRGRFAAAATRRTCGGQP